MISTNITYYFNKWSLPFVKNKRVKLIKMIPGIVFDWINSAAYYGDLYIARRDNIQEQIDAARAVYSDKFSVELHLNKIHLEDFEDNDEKSEVFLGYYLQVCGILQAKAACENIDRDIIVWYSTDAYEDATEYKSHTLSFALVNSEDDLYALDAGRYEDDFYIGAKITVDRAV